MEQLISFLAHNFYFVIIVVGILYSMFFRKSPLERKPNRMPDFGGNRPRPEARPQPTRSQPRQERPMPTLETRSISSKPPAKSDQPKSEAPVRMDLPSSDDAGSSGTSSAERTLAAPSSSRPDVARMNPAALARSDVARAVIWAEILGPPRAKKPYRR